MTRVMPTKDNSVFALDIGTRTVIGVVALVESGILRVAAQHMLEHESRAMYDGQIHDIPKVAHTVLEVKRNLEKKIGFKLTGAAVAAAGRALVTIQSRAETEIENGVEIDMTMVNSLEIAGIKNAQKELEAGGDDKLERYYCVGYSVMKYYIDNYSVTNLLGHRGNLIRADILATFLPDSVINSLYAVLHRVDLVPLHLTLEPIAAIEAVIPENLRHLNLALVDIGAGTSDIAITRNGSVVSYGMSPVAGDEITEAISETFLTGFKEAEQIKRELDRDGVIIYKDILGSDNTAAATEVTAIIETPLERLSTDVAQTIINLNGGEPPRAVFCVGGGSRLPGLSEKLAGCLGIDPKKIAVRGRDAVQGLVVEEAGLEGPEGVTVVGIAAVAVKKLGQDFVSIKVDGKEFSLFNSSGLNVSNVLGQVDFNPRDLITQNGKNLKFILNGNSQVVYGGLAKPAEIYINGEPANLQSPIKKGDEITVLKAISGEDARAYVRDYLGVLTGLSVTINGDLKVFEPEWALNGEPVPADSEIKDGDRLEVKTVRTARDLFEGTDLSQWVIRVNGTEVSSGYELKDGDAVELGEKKTFKPEKAFAPVPQKEFKASAGEAEISVSVNGNPVKLEGRWQYIFVDVFNHIDFDRTNPQGALILKLNGAKAKYTDVIKDGDDIEIYWDR